MKNYFKIIGSRSQKEFLKKIDTKNKNKVLFKYQKLISLNENNILKENERLKFFHVGFFSRIIFLDFGTTWCPKARF